MPQTPAAAGSATRPSAAASSVADEDVAGQDVTYEMDLPAPREEPGDGQPAGESRPRGGGAADEQRPLSTAEQDAVRNDPAVKRIVELFEGKIVDMRRVRRGGA